MKTVKFLLLYFMVLASPTFAQQDAIGEGFSKANRKSIDRKMSNLINRVSEETSCPAEKITFQVLEKYTTFYSKSDRHLPERIEFQSCGQRVVYKHNGLSGAALYWLLGSWVQEKE